MEENHLIIFVKNPVLGKVKTRLAKDLGDAKALEIYLQLLELTRIAVSSVDCLRNVFYSDEIISDGWDDDRFNKFAQEGADLGARMQNAFEQVFALGAHKAIIVGSDCPGLNADLIETAFKVLDDKDVCIGPAKDGGYYLLGMKNLNSFLFEQKEWSTDTVFQDTVTDLLENRLTYESLPLLSDVDTIHDLHLIR